MAVFTNQASVSYNGVTVNSNLATGEIRDALSIDKVALTDGYSVGEEKTFIISIVNSCPTDVAGVTVTDDLGAYEFEGQTVYPLTYVDGSIKMFTEGVANPAPAISSDEGLIISGLTVPASSNVLLVYSVTVNEFASPLTDSEITNTATLTSATQGPISDSETITAEEASLLSVSKSISPQSAPGCEDMTFTFVISNTGNTDADDVVLTDAFEIALSNLQVTLDGEALSQGTDYTYSTETGVFSTTAGVITVPAATFEQTGTGSWITNPGSAVLTITADV